MLETLTQTAHYIEPSATPARLEALLLAQAFLFAVQLVPNFTPLD